MSPPGRPLDPTDAGGGRAGGPAQGEETLPREFGAYTLLERLGAGAGGIVYRALHRELGREVALKVLRSTLDERARKRFQREARACARVRHERMVEVYEAGESDGQAWYAMTLVNGRPLSEVIQAGELGEPETFCGRMAELVDAVHALHEAGIVHRDIKPSNLVVEPDGRLVLADFGLARMAEAEGVTRSGEMIGTPLYMSPEQIRGRQEDVDARTDVYGLGATLYESLVGQPPFDAPSIASLMGRILRERPRAPRVVRPGLPAPVERMVLKCLEKRPEDRYESAAALAADLRSFAEGRSVQGRPVSQARRALRWGRRHAAPLGAAALVAAGLILWQALAPARCRLRVTSVAGALASVNEGEFRPVPIETEVERGSLLRVTVKRKGFVTGDYEMRPDSASLLIPACLAPDPEHATPAEYDLLARCARIEESAEDEVEPLSREEFSKRPRSTGLGRFAVPIHPRGAVRVDDARSWRLEMGELYAGGGVLRFWIDGEVVATVEGMDDRVNEGRMPEALRARLEPGVRVEWGMDPARPVPVDRASFEVVDEVPAAELRRVRERLERLGRIPPASRAWFEARVLAGQDLLTAAYLRLRSAREEEGSIHLTPMLLEARLLEDLLWEAQPEDVLTDTRAWQDLRAAAAALVSGD